MKRNLVILSLMGVVLLGLSGCAVEPPARGNIPGSMLLFPYWDNTGTMRTIHRGGSPARVIRCRIRRWPW